MNIPGTHTLKISESKTNQASRQPIRYQKNRWQNQRNRSATAGFCDIGEFKSYLPVGPWARVLGPLADDRGVETSRYRAVG